MDVYIVKRKGYALIVGTSEKGKKWLAVNTEGMVSMRIDIDEIYFMEQFLTKEGLEVYTR